MSAMVMPPSPWRSRVRWAECAIPRPPAFKFRSSIPRTIAPAVAPGGFLRWYISSCLALNSGKRTKNSSLGGIDAHDDDRPNDARPSSSSSSSRSRPFPPFPPPPPPPSTTGAEAAAPEGPSSFQDAGNAPFQPPFAHFPPPSYSATTNVGRYVPSSVGKGVAKVG